MRAWVLISMVGALFFSTQIFAVERIDLNRSPSSVLSTFLPTHSLKASHNNNSLQEVRKTIDGNGTVHLHVKQHYAGVKVWGGEAVIHIPHQAHANLNLMMLTKKVSSPETYMSGTLYQDIHTDLQNPPTEIFTSLKAEDALTHAINLSKLNAATIVKQSKELLVFVDDDNKAHWAYYISLYAKINNLPTAPEYLLDAKDFKVLRSWNSIKRLEEVEAGGIGGNKKMGKLVYDGTPKHLPKLIMQRDAIKGLCFIANQDVSVTDFRTNQIAQFACARKSAKHLNLYWNAETDFINDGYSPNNDALYAGKIIKSLYQDWFGIPVLSIDSKPMLLEMVTHAKLMDADGYFDVENAAWDPFEEKMFFGDGQDIFYPLTSLGVAAHEISHGFTTQQSALHYFDQSGGLDESFSDMATQAAEFYAYGKNTWQIGSEILKEKNTSLRYMDIPSKDCQDEKKHQPKKCSIDHIRDYKTGMNVHYSSGIYNRVFYLIANHPDWDVKKAFSVMVKANRDYWTPSVTFEQAGCDIIHAAKDYKYKVTAVVNALADVGIDTSKCL